MTEPALPDIDGSDGTPADPTTTAPSTGQLELPGLSDAIRPAVARPGAKEWADTDPVAQVLVFAHVPHLSGVYDYAVPRGLADQAQPGHLVRVRFSGRLTDGFVVRRLASTGYVGTLAPIDRVITSYRLLQPDVADAAQTLAVRYGGTWADVLRLAVPSRHARAEAAALARAETTTAGSARRQGASPDTTASEAAVITADSVASREGTSSAENVDAEQELVAPDWEGLDSYTAGRAFVARCVGGDAPVAWLQALPGATVDAVPHWARTLSGYVWSLLHAEPSATSRANVAEMANQDAAPAEQELAGAEVGAESGGVGGEGSSGARSVIVVCPDRRVVEHVVAALGAWLPEESLAVLHTDAGAETRFGEYVSCLAGAVRVVVGTRSAAWAPVAGLVATMVVEPSAGTMVDGRSPHVRAVDVARARGALTGAGTLVVEWAGSLVCRRWVATGVAKELVPVAGVRRAVLPQCEVVWARDSDPLGGRGGLSSEVVRAAREAVTRGPVLVHSAHWSGPAAVRCKGCSGRVRCRECAYPLTVAAAPSGGVVRDGVPSCRQCLRAVGAWRCGECGSSEWVVWASSSDRAVGDVGRLVPGAKVVMVTAERRSVRHPGGPGVVVVSTRGAEPVVPGGYALVVVLDARRLWDAETADADVVAVQTWARLVGLAAPARAGGRVLFTETDPQGLMEAVCRDRAPALVDALVAERAEVGAAPVVPSVALAGPKQAVLGVFDEWGRTPGVVPWRVWGPVTDGEGVRLLVVPPVELTGAAEIARWQRAAAEQVAGVRTGRAVRGLPVPQAVVAPI